jgi:hypothetical protein
MHDRTDLEVVLLGSLGARKALFGLFLLSLVADIEMLLPETAYLYGTILPNPWGMGVHLLMFAIGATTLIAAILIWLTMFYLCMHDSERSLGSRLLWGLVFVFSIWLGAQIFYLFPYRQFMKHRLQSGT